MRKFTAEAAMLLRRIWTFRLVTLAGPRVYFTALSSYNPPHPHKGRIDQGNPPREEFPLDVNADEAPKKKKICSLKSTKRKPEACEHSLSRTAVCCRVRAAVEQLDNAVVS